MWMSQTGRGDLGAAAVAEKIATVTLNNINTQTAKTSSRFSREASCSSYLENGDVHVHAIYNDLLTYL